MNKKEALVSIAIVSFVAGAGFTVVERYNYRESHLARLRANPDLIEIKDGIFCMKSATEELSTEQMIGDGFCNTHFSRMRSWF
jgi:hypothetical protein